MSTIRQILAAHGGLTTPLDDIGDDDDLFAAGLTSHATVTVMLACEDAFAVEFPQALVRRTTFSTVANLRSVMVTLGVTFDDDAVVPTALADSADAPVASA